MSLNMIDLPVPNLISATDSMGSATMERDAYGRLAKIINTKGNDTITQWVQRDQNDLIEWEYESQGGVSKSARMGRDDYFQVNSRTVADAYGSSVMTYDRTDPATGAYDFTGRLHGVTVDGLTQRFEYDAVNRGLMVRARYENAPHGIDSMIEEKAYNGVLLTSVKSAGGLEKTFLYGPMGWVEGESTTVNGALVDQIQFVRDSIGQVVKAIRSVGSVEGYGFVQQFDPKTGMLTGKKDGVFSLRQFNKPYSSVQAATSTTVKYDRTNPFRIQGTTTTGANPKSVQYTFDGLTGATATVNGVPIITDARGNITDDGINQYKFDAFDRLSVAQGQVDAVSLSYDIDGQLRNVSNSAKSETHIWSMGEVFSTKSGQDTTYRAYSSGVMNQQVAQYTVNTSGTKKLYTSWVNESPSNSVDDTGRVLESAEYSIGGDSRVYAGQSTIPQKYSETGRGFHGNLALGEYGIPELFYVRERFYNAETQRFLSNDTIKHSAQNVNHSYPVYGSDKTGLMPQTGLERRMDKAFATPEGATTYMKDQRELVKDIYQKDWAADCKTESSWLKGLIYGGQFIAQGVGIALVAVPTITVAVAAAPVEAVALVATGAGSFFAGVGVGSTIKKVQDGAPKYEVIVDGFFTAFDVFAVTKTVKFARSCAPPTSTNPLAAIDEINQPKTLTPAETVVIKAPETPATPANTAAAKAANDPSCSPCVADFRKMIADGNASVINSKPEIYRGSGDIIDMVNNPNKYFSEELQEALFIEAYRSESAAIWRAFDIDTKWYHHPLAGLLFSQEEIRRCQDFDELLARQFPKNFDDHEQRLLNILIKDGAKKERADGRFLKEFYKDFPMNPDDIPDFMPDDPWR